MVPVVKAWQKAGAWLPTEPHETVTAMLDRLKVNGDLTYACDQDVIGAWRDAGCVGSTVDPYGPTITVDTGGRCPVEGGERIIGKHLQRDDFYEMNARTFDWSRPRAFRRIAKDHPGDTYWHGKEETIPENGKAGLDVMDLVVDVGHVDGFRRVCTVSWGPRCAFRRWLK